MNPENQRRKFLITGIRWSLLGCLSFFGLREVVDRKRLGESCIKLDACRDCLEYDGDCALPKALKARKDEKLPKNIGTNK